MHSFGLSHEYHDFAVNSDKARSMVRDMSFQIPRHSPCRCLTSRNSALIKTLPAAVSSKRSRALSILLIRDGGFATVSWTRNIQNSVVHWTRQDIEVLNLHCRYIMIEVVAPTFVCTLNSTGGHIVPKIECAITLAFEIDRRHEQYLSDRHIY